MQGEMPILAVLWRATGREYRLYRLEHPTPVLYVPVMRPMCPWVAGEEIARPYTPFVEFRLTVGLEEAARLYAVGRRRYHFLELLHPEFSPMLEREKGVDVALRRELELPVKCSGCGTMLERSTLCTLCLESIRWRHGIEIRTSPAPRAVPS